MTRAAPGAVVAWTMLLVAPVASAGDVGPVTRLVAELGECQDVGNPACRQVAIRLSNFGARAVPSLAKAFPKLSPAGQILGLVTLDKIKTRSSTRALIKLSARSSLVIRALALATLGPRKGRAVDNALLKGLKDKQPTIRVAAAEAIGRSRSARNVKRMVPPLVRAARDADTEVRIAAIESLGMLGDKRGVPPMRAALHARQPKLRKTALFALRFVADQRAVPDVIELLRDDDRMMVRDAGKTLERITGVDFGVDYELWKGWWEARKR